MCNIKTVQTKKTSLILRFYRFSFCSFTTTKHRKLIVFQICQFIYPCTGYLSPIRLSFLWGINGPIGCGTTLGNLTYSIVVYFFESSLSVQYIGLVEHKLVSYTYLGAMYAIFHIHPCQSFIQTILNSSGN